MASCLMLHVAVRLLFSPLPPTIEPFLRWISTDLRQILTMLNEPEAGTKRKLDSSGKANNDIEPPKKRSAGTMTKDKTHKKYTPKKYTLKKRTAAVTMTKASAKEQEEKKDTPKKRSAVTTAKDMNKPDNEASAKEQEDVGPSNTTLRSLDNKD